MFNTIMIVMAGVVGKYTLSQNVSLRTLSEESMA